MAVGCGVPIGAYVTVHHPFADVRSERGEDADRVVADPERAVRISRDRNIDINPTLGREQLVTIA